MVVAQITAKGNPLLKKSFMQKSQEYDLPASGVLSILMRMFVNGDIIPSFRVNSDDTHASFYAGQNMIDVNEPIENVLTALERIPSRWSHEKNI
jgi:hypothetical protein